MIFIIELLYSNKLGMRNGQSGFFFDFSNNRIIKRLKNKYDDVEKFSTILPPRKSSEKEKYLDNN